MEGGDDRSLKLGLGEVVLSGSTELRLHFGERLLEELMVEVGVIGQT